MLSKLLNAPAIFDLQQKVCNNYENVKLEFADYVDAEKLHILDVGCSTGVCGQAIFDTARNEYTGIDITPKYIEYANRVNSHGRYLVMDGRQLDFPDDSFDLVSFIGVLHHMEDAIAKACLEEVHRVIKPSGYLLIAEPVFTANALASNMLLSLDRGKFIRESAEYINLAPQFEVVRKRYFNLSLHRFVSLIATPKKAVQA